MKKQIVKLIEKLGYTISKSEKSAAQYPDIIHTEFWEIYNLCSQYTMTSVARMYALYCSVAYVLSNNIKGSFVECGVWRGGSAMLIAKMLNNRKITDRKIYLYDTFEGMSKPTNADLDYSGRSASELLNENVHNKEESVWCLADLADVQRNLSLTGFQESNLVYVKGTVETTIPAALPEGRIALLRLDTDWYESTKHELNHLFPLLELNGVLIIDDYGHWEGCRKAVDEYFAEHKTCILLNRIDYTGRIGVKSAL